MVIVGMDEVGRGSWAGPVVVGAVIIGAPVAGLKDSKLLTRRQRQKIDEQLRASALAHSIGAASPLEIDELGLSAALSLAYRRALAGIAVDYDMVIIDGSYNFLPKYTKVQMCVKADQYVPAVSAASIIAKVARDDMMCRLALEYPEYGFERHVGYGTAMHAIALRQLGPCAIHRRSFAPIRRLIGIRV